MCLWETPWCVYIIFHSNLSPYFRDFFLQPIYPLSKTCNQLGASWPFFGASKFTMSYLPSHEEPCGILDLTETDKMSTIHLWVSSLHFHYPSYPYSSKKFKLHNHTSGTTYRLHKMNRTNESSISIIQIPINFPTILSTSLDLSKDLHQSLRVDINESQLSKPTIQHRTKIINSVIKSQFYIIIT